MGMRLDEFNHLTDDAAREEIAVWARIGPWVDDLAAGRPYASVDDLAAAAETGANAWTRAELDAALASHPRIGEKPRGHGSEAAASRSEQSAMQTADDALTRAIAEGNRAYESRFGRVFLIRAAGRTPAEILTELTRRLDNDDETEVSEALDQLAQIAVLRLRSTVRETDDTTFEEDR